MAPGGVQPATLVGVGVAILGNICVSLALNVQKLAHKRLRNNGHSSDDHLPQTLRTSPSRRRSPSGLSERSALLWSAQRPFYDIPRNSDRGQDHGTSIHVLPDARPCAHRRPLGPSKSTSEVPAGSHDPSTPFQTPSYSSPILQRYILSEDGSGGSDDDDGRVVGSKLYLRSNLWWTGLLLMMMGETGNFISYGFAPASIVAPLGTFALISNCAFAPLILGEKFQKADLLGIGIAILGACTVVVSGQSSDAVFDPDEMRRAISQPAFIAYAVGVIFATSILAAVSRMPVATRYLQIDVGVCALLGSFTVLATKAISSFLTTSGLDCLRKWITWPILAVLGFTAVAQVVFLNKALQNFDAKEVIPTQFVSFTVSSIIGSAILYGDFREINFYRGANFAWGCLTTFIGVYILTRRQAQGHGATPTRTDYTRDAPSRAASGPAPATPALKARSSHPSLPITGPGYFFVAASPLNSHQLDRLAGNQFEQPEPGDEPSGASGQVTLSRETVITR